MLALAMVCCASSGAPASTPTGGADSDVGEVQAKQGAQSSESEPLSASASSGSPGDWLRDGRGAEPGGALPEVGIEHFGMHIGGESNAPEAKAPLLSALETRFDELLHCYRLVSEPLDTGSFGADLQIGRTGGPPQITSTRQKLGGDEFEACVSQALLSVEFPTRARPVVVSYSFLYTVADSSGGAASEP